MKLRISGSRGHREINLPVKDAELAHLRGSSVWTPVRRQT